MTPHNFPQANQTFNAPTNLDESQVFPIKAYSGELVGGNIDGAHIVVTAWLPSAEDLDRLNRGFPIFFSCIGGLPAHFLSTNFVVASNPGINLVNSTCPGCGEKSYWRSDGWKRNEMRVVSCNACNRPFEVMLNRIESPLEAEWREARGQNKNRCGGCHTKDGKKMIRCFRPEGHGGECLFD